MNESRDGARRFYHEQYTGFDPRVAQAVAEFEARKPWSMSADDQEEAAHALVLLLCDLYEVPGVTLVIDTTLPGLGGYGILADLHELDANEPGLSRPVIVLHHFSLMTLLFNFRIHLLETRPELLRLRGDADDVRAWSASLFYAACPRRFRRMAGEGRLAYV